MHKKSLFTLFIVFCSFYAQSKSLSQVLSNTSQFKLGTTQPVLVNDHIIFTNGEQLSSEGRPQIWSYNTQNKSQVNLLNEELYPLIEPSFYVLDGYAYFLINSGDFGTLWRSDGTPEGTSQVSAVNYMGPLKQNNGFLYAINDASQIVITDGTETGIHTVENTDLRTVCVFGINNIIHSYSNYFVQSKDGVETDLEMILWGGFNFVREPLIIHDNACYFVGTTINTGTGASRKFLQIDTNGNKTLLNSRLDQDGSLLSVTTHENNLFGVLNSPSGRKLIKFNEDISGIDASSDLPKIPGEYLFKMASVGDFLVPHFSINSNTPSHKAFVFDSDLNLVKTYPFNSNPPFYFANGYETSFENLVQINNNDTMGGDSHLLFEPYTTQEQILNLPLNNANFIVTNQHSPQVYVVSVAPNNSSTLYAVEESPEIGLLINGSWIDPSIRNQGFNIRKGIRQNGSEYVMVTAFTFRNGQPLWLAGMAELNLPQQSIEMVLSEYAGIGLFEPNATPDSTEFGTLELMMMSCNSLSATITTTSESFTMNLVRLDDVTFTQSCVD